MTTQCKAAVPSQCRFHGRGGYATNVKNLEEAHSHVAKAQTFANREYWEKLIVKYDIAKDASALGFKKLTRELQKKIKNGTVEEQAALITRLKKASALRLRDGYRSEWEESNKSFFALGSKIIELSKNTNTVKIPWALTGTQAMGFVAKRLEAEGYTVTELDVQSFNSVQHDADSMATIRANALQHLKDGGGETMWEHLDESNCLLRGMKFKDIAGREISLEGDIKLDREEREKAGY